MKFRPFLYVLIATVAVLLSIGVTGFYWLTGNRFSQVLPGTGQSSPSAAIFIPRQAPLMVSLLTNLDQLESFRVAIAPAKDRQRVRADLAQLKQTVLSKRGLDYEQDIQPWLGNEITLAVTTLDMDRNAENGQQPGYLLVIETQDSQQAREFVQLFWQKQVLAGLDLVFEQYAGVKIIYGNSPDSDPSLPSDSALSTSTILSTAAVGDRFLLIANHPKVLRDAINNVQASDLSLQESQSYQDALSHLPNPQMGTVVVNLSSLNNWLGEQLEAIPLVEDNGSRLYENLVMGLQLTTKGILADTVLTATPGQTLPSVKPALSKLSDALQWIPAGTPFSVASVDLHRFWEWVSTEQLNDNLLSRLVNQSFAALQTNLGTPLSADWFDWVAQDYALALIPAADPATPDWIFVAQRSPATTDALNHLDTLARQQNLSVGPLVLGDRDVSAWTKLSTTATTGNRQANLTLQAEVKGVHTTVGNYEVFATSVDALNQALQASSQPLQNSPDFQDAIASLSPTNDGYLYLDWQAIRGTVEQRIPFVKLGELVVRPVLDQVRSVTITSYGSDATTRQGAVFIHLRN